MKIAISADHTGFPYIQELIKHVDGLGHQCQNFGPQKLEIGDDYPDFVQPATEAVSSGDCEMGIILGGSGQGEAMVANRNKNVRCAVFYGFVKPKLAINAEGENSQDDKSILRLSREHNNANMLSLSVRFLTLDEIKQAVEYWLSVEFSHDERHIRRIKKMDGERLDG